MYVRILFYFFFFLFFFFFLYFSFGKEDLPFTYDYRSFPSSIFFLLLHPTAAAYMQTFSSRLLLLVGKAFLFVVAPAPFARSFARTATTSNSVADTS
jgi:hypothetical protein